MEPDSKSKLIAAAHTVFARKGYDGTTVKELADEAGVNISLVSYYFGGKEGLYQAAIEAIGRDRLEAANRILRAPQSFEDFRVRLRLFVEEFIGFHLEKRDICAILDRDICGIIGSGQSQLTSSFRRIFQDTFLKAHEKLHEFFGEAQKLGLLDADVDVTIMSFQLFSILTSALRYDRFGKEFYGKSFEDKEYREEFLSHIFTYFLRGYLKKGIS